MPTIEEVCSTFGLQDVDIEYSESDFQNLTSYKLFQQHVRPLLTKENPKVCLFMKKCFLSQFYILAVFYLNIGSVHFLLNQSDLMIHFHLK